MGHAILAEKMLLTAFSVFPGRKSNVDDPATCWRHESGDMIMERVTRPFLEQCPTHILLFLSTKGHRLFRFALYGILCALAPKFGVGS